ncbi:hypothetical protein [Mitsuokella multacida]|uniref:Uncharacterized protein n=1 Tax=Mitsuokella multacida DSM 20544 TaxID=500635 RepID=C9KJD1_9FIRM|nr:hypothetical protein [Mitsuokella multacida]EEX69997.1 hypothetical protein MITSMUL_03128 [Mitsuokella multacida DSM 20544]
MKGYEQISIQNRPCAIVYKGEHYAIRWASGRVERMAKADIVKKFHLHRDALDRHIAGGFKRHWAMADEDVVRVNRSLNYVENVTFFIVSAIVMIPQVFLILAVIIGYIDGHALRPYVAPMVALSLAAMFGAVVIPEILADKFDFVLGIKREA